jgi:hypothetical protein
MSRRTSRPPKKPVKQLFYEFSGRIYCPFSANFFYLQAPHKRQFSIISYYTTKPPFLQGEKERGLHYFVQIIQRVTARQIPFQRPGLERPQDPVLKHPCSAGI